ncbi:MAG: glutathione S-transferase family protein [Burkholderiales bacterium]
MTQPEIILHHYARSPFSEKIRIAFGLKGVRWRAVEQPRMAPKPALTALTGGYRRIPVLQIGADIYCDTRCILHELERRFPSPTLHPSSARGSAEIVAAWADRHLFACALGLVFGLHGERFPPELHADRARFTAGRFDAWNSDKMKARIPELRNQLRTHLAWLEQVLHDGRPFLLGVAPSLADLAVYHPLWYARGNLAEEAGLQDFHRLSAWLARIEAIGHGSMEKLSAEEALAIARNTQLAPSNFAAAESSSPYRPGARLSVMPTDWGFDAVEGRLIGIDRDSIALRRDGAETGSVIVHFPRDGFAVTAAD